MTEKKLAANRANARKSTGPRTPEGKRRASLNALRHGLRSVSLAVLDMEDPRDWAAHRDQVVQDLSPAGYLEAALAERVAGLLWRLWRVARYESLSISTSMETVVADYMAGHRYEPGAAHPEDLEVMAEVTKEQLDIFEALPRMKATQKVDPVTAWSLVEKAAQAAGLNLPRESEEEGSTGAIGPNEVPEGAEPEAWTGWTAGVLRAVLQRVAEEAKVDPADMRAGVLKDLTMAAYGAQAKADAARDELERQRRERLLPKEEILEKVSRYEAHLERSFFRVLHELQRLQAARSGMVSSPPAAVDLDVSVHGEAR